MNRGGKKGCRNKFDLRNDLKHRFARLHEDLLNEPYAPRCSELTDKAREAVRLARKLIGYSPKTADCDLYGSLLSFKKKRL